jgi:hypothetical protein
MKERKEERFHLLHPPAATSSSSFPQCHDVPSAAVSVKSPLVSLEVDEPLVKHLKYIMFPV